MNRGILLCREVLCVLAVLLSGSASLWAQKVAVPSRVVDAVDDARTMRLQGNVHPLARAAYDHGALADSQPMTRMLLLLQRSQEQETSLRQLLENQQTKGSGNYHAWLTPEQFGKQYGPSDADVQTVTDWLTRQGFQVAKVSAGRTVIEFSGNVAQVRNAFHTEMHRYVVDGKEHFANVSDPAIPEALSPVVAGVVALHNFPKVAQVRSSGVYSRNPETGELLPLFTHGTPAKFALGPGDFATIYKIPAGADGGTNGGGPAGQQQIAVVGQSNINIQNVRDFRTLFGLPPNDPQIIVNGPDPGLQPGDEGESDLDVEWAGAVAPAAQILFVTSLSAFTDPLQVIGGVDLSALYIIDNNLAPVMSESYGACEGVLGTTGNAFYNAMWQQAAAEGITVVISSGDNGSASCDPTLTSPNAAVNGVFVSGVASTPYNVAAGGTDFDGSTQNSTYWNPASGTINSALQYIPETTWDDSSCAINYPAACTTVNSNGFDVVGAGGGPSNCAVLSGTSCSQGYAKPSYQVGITPSGTGYTTRLVPDVSLFASNNQNGVALVVCDTGSTPCSPTQFSLVGGTSASTPTFAGIMALVNQKTGGRQGNANYVLYALAAKDTNYTGGLCNSSLGNTPAAGCVFNDITKGNISVACVANTPNCSNTTTSGFGVLVYPGSTSSALAPAFTAGAGYDLATGLGSINVTNLLNHWTSGVRAAPTTTLTSPSGGSPSGQPFTATVTVAPAPSGTESVAVNALASDKTTILGTFGPFPLTGGTASISTNLLPPGTANVQATYGGDASLAASTSPVVALGSTVSGTNQASKTTLSFVTFDANNNPILNTSGNVAYGSPYVLQVAVTNSGGLACTSSGTLTTPGSPCPTGTVALTDNGSPLNDFPNGATPNATNVAKLNAHGIVEDQPVQFAAGSHSIVAAYTSGDTNFISSTSNTLSVTVSKATPVGVAVASSLGSITKGTSVTFTAYVVTTSNGAGPTGSMTFTNGSTSLGSATCAPTSGAENTNPPISQIGAGSAYCTATLTAAISSLYPPPGNGRRTPWMPLTPILVVLMSAVLFALGWRWMPESRRRSYAYAGLLVFALLVAGIAGCGGGSGGGGGGGGGTRTITAAYPGDANYAASSGSVSITVQ